eukprot:6201481-Pleurochrysis_carterae.AAC.1
MERDLVFEHATAQMRVSLQLAWASASAWASADSSVCGRVGEAGALTVRPLARGLRSSTSSSASASRGSSPTWRGGRSASRA